MQCVASIDQQQSDTSMRHHYSPHPSIHQQPSQLAPVCNPSAALFDHHRKTHGFDFVIILLVLPLEGNSLWDSCRGSSNPCTRSIPLNARICDTTEDSLAVACLVIGSLAGASGHQYSQQNDSHLTLRGLMAQVLHDHRQSHLLRYEEDHEAFPFGACLSWFPHTKIWSQNTSIYSLRQYMVMSSIYCSGGRRWAVVDTDRGQNYVFLPAMSLD